MFVSVYILSVYVSVEIALTSNKDGRGTLGDAWDNCWTVPSVPGHPK